MDDLKIIEILLGHCDFEPQLRVSGQEISISIKDNIQYDGEYFSQLRQALAETTGRKVARIQKDFFISRTIPSVAERNAKTFLSHARS
ncbi:hypothetical protein E0K83_03770 [Gramella sp. BOM4]|nr:hypothetical protein [Christiangramia bathymodioli]